MSQDKPESWENWWKKVKTLPSPLEDDYLTIEHYEIASINQEFFPKLKGQLILEAGCGTARHSVTFAGENFTVGVDFSLGALKLAKALPIQCGCKGNMDFVLASDLQLPFKDDLFSLVWNAGVLEHFKGVARQQVIDEMARVTKTGGYVAAFVPNAQNIRIKGAGLLSQSHNCFSEIPYSSIELETNFSNAKLQMVGRSGTHLFLPFDWLFNRLRILPNVKQSWVLRGLLGFRRWFEPFYALYGFELFRIGRKR